MRPLAILKLLSFLIDELGFPACRELSPVQAFVAQLTFENFHKAISPRGARLNISRTDFLPLPPFHHRRGHRLNNVIRMDIRQLALQVNQPQKRQDHILTRIKLHNSMDRHCHVCSSKTRSSLIMPPLASWEHIKSQPHTLLEYVMLDMRMSVPQRRFKVINAGN
ncbi:hypothetical protein [Undibacterium squillarum]|uniref:hypothetical protein n=1 Tax=Undibacterium squillarum TaxID=1131567 RepID=UPI004040BA1E